MTQGAHDISHSPLVQKAMEEYRGYRQTELPAKEQRFFTALIDIAARELDRSDNDRRDIIVVQILLAKFPGFVGEKACHGQRHVYDRMRATFGENVARMMDAVLQQNNIGVAAKTMPDIATGGHVAFIASIASLDPRTTKGYDWRAALKGQQEKIACMEKADAGDTDIARLHRRHAAILTAHMHTAAHYAARRTAPRSGPHL